MASGPQQPQIARFGAFRRRYARATKSAAVPPADKAGAVVAPSNVRLQKAESLIRLVHRQRRIVRRYARFGSAWCYAIERAAWSRALVNVVGNGHRDGGLLARGLFSAIRLFLTGTVLLHFAAGQTRRLATSGRTLNLLFRSDIVRRRAPVCHAYCQALMRANLIERAAHELKDREDLDDYYLNLFFGTIAVQVGRHVEACHYLGRAIALSPDSPDAYRLLGRSLAVEGRIDEAKAYFQESVVRAPNTVMAHQNLAGRYDIAHYQPKQWELEEAGALLVYDNLGRHAEDLYLRGRFAECMRCYGQMLDYQAGIARGRALPEPLRQRIATECPMFQPELPVRILPYEWVTQFGHIGTVEAYLRRAALGEVAPANHVLLAPPNKVANQSLLNCLDGKLCVIRDDALVDELFPYQRYFGEGFIATRGPGGAVEPFARAAARAQIEWARQSRGPLLTLKPADLVEGRAALASLGLPEDAWYVGLHVREAGFHGEVSGDMSAHRNAGIADYFGAIAEITARGGWVLRLGDKTMRPLPQMEGVIDYAVSSAKSERTDLFILATSRFVIGTTSGLTAVAQAFGTQMMLVNCISPDWQLWTDDVDFVLKRVWNRRHGRYLSIGETYRQPLQGMLINDILLDRPGYEAHANSPEEIRAAVRYKLDVLEGVRPRLDENDPLMLRYRREIAHEPCLFGAGRPALPFLEAEAAAGALANALPRQSETAA